MTNGQIAFEAWNQDKQWSDWSDLEPDVRERWERAAQAVIDTFAQVEHTYKEVSIESCARCGGNHQKLWFKKMSEPFVEDNGVVWGWWASCPLTHDPIMLRVQEGGQE